MGKGSQELWSLSSLHKLQALSMKTVSFPITEQTNKNSFYTLGERPCELGDLLCLIKCPKSCESQFSF